MDTPRQAMLRTERRQHGGGGGAEGQGAAVLARGVR
jgi:hypothetical protein